MICSHPLSPQNGISMQIFDTHGMGSYRSDRIHRRQYIRIPYGYADVYCVRYYKASGKISKHIEWMWVMFLDILFGYKDMKIINACIPLIKTNQYKGILCSTYRTFPLTAAKTLAIHTNLPFRRGFTRYYRAIRLQRIYIA